MAIKIGAPVRQKVAAPIEGTVEERRFNDSQDQMEYLVASPDTDGDGEPQRRWFLEADLQQTGEPPVIVNELGPNVDPAGGPA